MNHKLNYIHAYVHTYRRTDTHTCIRTDTRTYILKYIYIYAITDLSVDSVEIIINIGIESNINNGEHHASSGTICIILTASPSLMLSCKAAKST